MDFLTNTVHDHNNSLLFKKSVFLHGKNHTYNDVERVILPSTQYIFCMSIKKILGG